MPEAWRIAFETAEQGEVTGAQDMLLGINAHVQNDMPFVLAQLGLRDRKGRARKPDHDKTNEALAAGYERVVGAGAEPLRPVDLADQSRLAVRRRHRRPGDRARMARAGLAQRRAAGQRRRATPSGRRSPSEIQANAAGWARVDRGDADAGLSRDARRLLRRAARRLSARFSVRSVCEHTFVSDHDPNLKGNVAELKIAAEAARLGIDVLRPMTEHCRYDLVFEVGGELLRVQCKWAPSRRRGDQSSGCVTNRRGPNGFIRTHVHGRRDRCDRGLLPGTRSVLPASDRCRATA